MTERRAQVVLLCEDLQQKTFFYRLLIAYGFPGRRIRVESTPAGKQAAE